MTKLVMIYKEFSYTSFNLIQQHTPSIVLQSHKRGLGRVEFTQILPLPWQVERLFPIDRRRSENKNTTFMKI